MKRALILAILIVLPAAAVAGSIAGSPLALRSIGAERAPRAAAPLRAPTFTSPDDSGELLAQRVLSREWGASDDTHYVEIEVPGYKSEGGAMALSALVPGAGQYYVGEGSGWWFLLAEAASWTARVVFDQQADDRRDDAPQFAGSPEDPASHWSFARYYAATNADTLALRELYAADPEAFYHAVGFDDRYRTGWSDGGASRGSFQDLDQKFQNGLKRVRYATGAIILTHVVAALDALHAAREHNLPLERNLHLKLNGSLGSEGERMTLALERKF